MAKRCVFCGKNLSFFDDKTLLCGNALQRVCTACWAELQDLDQEERAHLALDTGRAEEPEVIQAYLDRLEQMRQAQARAREALKTDKRCLRCGGVMERYGRKGARGLLKEVSLFDVYRGKGVDEGKKSVAFNLVLRADDRSLTSEEADEDVKSILETLKTDCDAVLR